MSKKLCENTELIRIILEQFESSTSKIIDQLNLNFSKQTDHLSSEIFDLKTQMDALAKENKKLKEEMIF